MTANGSPETEEAVPTESDKERINELVRGLTTAEKLRLVRGAAPPWREQLGGAAGYLPGIDRLEIPPLRFEDGPLGVRSARGTAFPAPIALGASFDPELADAFGRAIGAEARAHEIDVLLAPGCNIIRVPQGGRNFEYFSEDPVLSARMAVAVVTGIQSRGVVATPKHYVANNHEHQRVTASAEVDERTLRELYLRPFAAAVREGDAGAVMAAYNRINGTYATEHDRLLTAVLKTEFGFDGPVISDWWAVQDGPAAARAGLDLEMPGLGAIGQRSLSQSGLRYLRAMGRYWPQRLPGLEGLAARLFEQVRAPGGMPRPRSSVFARTLPASRENGALSASRLDDMVRRVLSLHARVGALTGNRPKANVDRAHHQALAERIASTGTVLLKNGPAGLPLDPSTTVAMIGPHVDEAKTGGGGSSEVVTDAGVSPLDGVRARATGHIHSARGHPPIERSSLAALNPLPALRRATPWRSSIQEARSVARSADVAVVVVQDDATEGEDRTSLSLPGEQDALVSAVAASADRTVVVLQTAGPIEMPWLGDVDAVLEAWYPGQQAGHAIAAVLFGDTDPGGRLPVTFGRNERDYPTAPPARYPGITTSTGIRQVSYDEGTAIGYRHFDEHDVDPLFPFGHGLSYTDFAYDAVEVTTDGTDRSVAVTVENTGDRAGREVVQVYLEPPPSDRPRPPRALVGFAPVTLPAGGEQRVCIDLDDNPFATYDTDANEWLVEEGTATLGVGRSSRDLHTQTPVTISKE